MFEINAKKIIFGKKVIEATKSVVLKCSSSLYSSPVSVSFVVPDLVVEWNHAQWLQYAFQCDCSVWNETHTRKLFYHGYNQMHGEFIDAMHRVWFQHTKHK